MDIQTQITQLKQEFEKKLNQLNDSKDLDNLFLEYFSKRHGLITNLIKLLADLPVEEKREYGPKINAIRNELKTLLEDKRLTLEQKITSDPKIDLTIPQKSQNIGMLHPTTQIILEMNKFFRYRGFSIVEGPEIETEKYTFRILNLPKGHPATDLQDTLYIEEDILLSTHTSSIEARILDKQEPPIRVAFPGKCYRNETYNASNGAFFFQYQGLVVEKGITLQHLKGTLEDFHKFLFGEDVELRYRYKYYPEVSPGMGVDMKCQLCKGVGCAVCKFRGWMEVLGSGMVHYNTLKMAGIDPEEYTGYAFGMGLDRLVMQRFGIDSIRKLYGEGIVYK